MSRIDLAGVPGEGSGGVPVAVGIPVGTAALRVGVSVSTLRSWETRYGLRPSQRTLGGHRRYSADDVAVLQRMQRLIHSGMTASAAAVAARDRRDRVERASRRRAADARAAERADLTGAPLDALDGAELTRLVAAVLDEQGTVRAWQDAFAPGLQAIGDHWAASGAHVEREHLLTSVIQTQLIRHAGRQKIVRPGIAVLAVATPHEEHVLPLYALAAGLAERGLTCCTLGTLPARAIRDAVASAAPAGLVLWARSSETREAALLRSLRGRVPVLCAAGPGWSPSRLPAGVTYVNDLSGALDVLGALTR